MVVNLILLLIYQQFCVGPKSRSRNKSGERSKTRKGQGQTINDKSPEKRKIILQQVQKNIDNEMNEMVNEKDRKFKKETRMGDDR